MNPPLASWLRLELQPGTFVHQSWLPPWARPDRAPCPVLDGGCGDRLLARSLRLRALDETVPAHGVAALAAISRTALDALLAALTQMQLPQRSSPADAAGPLHARLLAESLHWAPCWITGADEAQRDVLSRGMAEVRLARLGDHMPDAVAQRWRLRFPRRAPAVRAERNPALQHGEPARTVAAMLRALVHGESPDGATPWL